MNVACLLHVSQSICKQNTIEVGTGQNRNLHHLLKCHIKSSACSQLVRIYCVLALGMYLYIFPSWVRTLAYIKHLFISTRFLTCAHIILHISLWWRNMYSLLLNIYLNIPYTASISKISMNRKTKICFHLWTQPKKNLHKNDEWNIEFVTKTKKNLPNSLKSHGMSRIFGMLSCITDTLDMLCFLTKCFQSHTHCITAETSKRQRWLKTLDCFDANVVCVFFFIFPFTVAQGHAISQFVLIDQSLLISAYNL